jgi:hypothetical protein
LKKVLLIILTLVPLVTGFRNEGGGDDRKGFTAGYIDITVESNTSPLFFKYNLGGRCIPVDGILLKQKKEQDTESIYIIVPVREFQCPNVLVYKDFLDLLRENKYPFMNIALPRTSLFQLQKNDYLILHGVMISIAGVSRKYDIMCKIEKGDGQNNMLTGSVRIMLTDLEIAPPVKFLGLVKVRDEIIVNFGFCLTDGSAATNILSDN